MTTPLDIDAISSNIGMTEGLPSHYIESHLAKDCQALMALAGKLAWALEDGIMPATPDGFPVHPQDQRILDLLSRADVKKLMEMNKE